MEAWVGIDGGFGTVKAGVQLPPLVPSLIASDPCSASYFGSGVPIHTGAVFVNYKVAGSFDSRVYGGGLSYRFTPVTNVDAGVWHTSDGNDTNDHSNMAATGLTYSLSKATLLYGQCGFVDNRGKMNTGLSTNGALFGAAGTTLGSAVGIRHLF
ncbi:porin [Trinickia mobilis]|uniref:porin n=1 Tax=Trinickia mobilis TaxID=2816356 RepID=UPI001A8D05AE|nr:porin [Trinickia mobilis]